MRGVSDMKVSDMKDRTDRVDGMGEQGEDTCPNPLKNIPFDDWQVWTTRYVELSRYMLENWVWENWYKQPVNREGGS